MKQLRKYIIQGCLRIPIPKNWRFRLCELVMTKDEKKEFRDNLRIFEERNKQYREISWRMICRFPPAWWFESDVVADLPGGYTQAVEGLLCMVAFCGEDNALKLLKYHALDPISLGRIYGTFAEFPNYLREEGLLASPEEGGELLSPAFDWPYIRSILVHKLAHSINGESRLSGIWMTNMMLALGEVVPEANAVNLGLIGSKKI